MCSTLLGKGKCPVVLWSGLHVRVHELYLCFSVSSPTPQVKQDTGWLEMGCVPQVVQALMNSSRFGSGSQVFLGQAWFRGKACSGVFQNQCFYLSHAGSKSCFSCIHCEDLLELLEGNQTEAWPQTGSLSSSRVFNSQLSTVRLLFISHSSGFPTQQWSQRCVCSWASALVNCDVLYPIICLHFLFNGLPYNLTSDI